jgi:hypothetical protein
MSYSYSYQTFPLPVNSVDLLYYVCCIFEIVQVTEGRK